VTERIEVGLRSGIDDPRGRSVMAQAREFLGLAVEDVRTRAVYKLSLDLSAEELEQVRLALTDPVLEESASGRLPPPPCHWILAVGFRAGVTDNVGRTARIFVGDVVGRLLSPAGRVFTETLYFVEGRGLSAAEVARLGNELLANDLIETLKIWPADRYLETPIDLELPLADSSEPPRVVTVPLPNSPEELLALSRRRTLSLSLAELRAIRDHYLRPEVQDRRAALGLPRDPTDVEIEALAQTWSEHCKHKIFNATIHYTDDRGREETIRSLFQTYIVGVTQRIARSASWLVSVFDDNAGVVRVSGDTNLVYKVETHNSPSALDPYGGAMTGIVGVNRDPLGTGLGASLLTNVWGYCLASPSFADKIPQGLLHPRRIRDGVHRGVIDGGNQSGIPYSRGFECFDPRYLGKPLVFCGTVGTLPAQTAGRPGHVKEVRAGDIVVMVGGRIGKDGIHGATFSSEALHGESPAQAVQIGDPITQKVMADMLLEARDRGLYRAITDNGAGGLSSSVGELARLCGGAELDLETAPLKYAGLHPWEILLSEAQERMTLAVPPERLGALLDLARRREVEATPIGRFTSDSRFRLRHGKEVVGDLDMAFLHGGCPVMELEARWTPPRHLEPEDVGLDLAALDASVLLEAMLGRLNLCSRESKSRQYDHEVKGLSVVKPLVGVRGDIPSDAAVMRIHHGRPGAVLLAEAIAPRFSDVDAGAMAAHVVDLATRRIVAGGGRLGQIAGLDNFCWPDPVESETTPDGPQKLAALVRACQSLALMTEGLGVPCISGKDSMKNDSTRGGVKISIPPTLLFSTMGWMEDARGAMDLAPGDPQEAIYLLGETRGELGGSELLAHLAELHHQPRLVGNRVPRVTPGTCRTVCAAVQEAASSGLVRATHALHLGGLALGLARLCLASDLGLEACLDTVPGDLDLSPVEVLFSESGSRFLVTVAATDVRAFEEQLGHQGAPWCRIGVMAQEPVVRVTRRGATVIDRPLVDLRRRYRETLDAVR
jgi:phosphoribosylformylglycinamidine synthase